MIEIAEPYRLFSYNEEQYSRIVCLANFGTSGRFFLYMHARTYYLYLFYLLVVFNLISHAEDTLFLGTNDGFLESYIINTDDSSPRNVCVCDVCARYIPQRADIIIEL